MKVNSSRRSKFICAQWRSPSRCRCRWHPGDVQQTGRAQWPAEQRGRNCLRRRSSTDAERPRAPRGTACRASCATRWQPLAPPPSAPARPAAPPVRPPARILNRLLLFLLLLLCTRTIETKQSETFIEDWLHFLALSTKWRIACYIYGRVKTHV